MIRRLRIKFIFINMLIALVLLSVIFSMVLHFTRLNMEQESIQRMRTILSSRFQPAPPNTLPDVPPNLPAREPGLPYFIVHQPPQGQITTIESRGNYEDLSSEFLSELLEAVSLLPGESGTLPQYQLRFYRSSPNTRLIIFADISSEQALLQSLLKSCLFIGGISFAALFLTSLFGAYWAVLPVENAWKQQKQFIADASHELKTPLTVIMTNAEMLQEENYDQATKEQFSSNILVMTQQMRGLVERLLDLARLDNDSVQNSFTNIHFSQLVSDAILPFEPLYFEKGLELQCQLEKHLFVKGNIYQLRQVADILLDNALKYSFPHSTVSIRLMRQGSHCIFSVESVGETISHNDLKNIFKRFYRIDKARSMNHSYGLGLPIAERIVKEHRGKIWAESSHGHNCFLVQLSSVPAAN